MKQYINPETQCLTVNGQAIMVAFGINANSPAPESPARVSIESVDKTTGSW